MATNRPTRRPLVAPPSSPAVEPLQDDPNGEALGAADDLQSMMAELAGTSSSKVTVYRVVKGQPLGYVFACSPDAFSLDTLRDKYNGGEFRLFISKDGQLWKNRTVYVEPKQVSQAGEPAPTETATVVAMLREGFDKQAQLFAQVLRTVAAPPPPPPSPFAGINLVEAATAISTLLATLRPTAPPVITPPQGITPDRAIDMMMKGFELAREMKGDGGGEEPSMLGILRDLIKSPMLAQAVAATAAQAQAPAAPRIVQPRPPGQPQPQPTAPQPAQSFASETPPPQPQPDAMKALMNQYLGMLVHHAAAGSDPLLYADLVLDNLDEGTLRELLNRQPTAVDALIADYPPIAQHREWFETLVKAIADALADEAQSGIVIENEAPSDASGTATPTIPGGTPAG